MAVSAVGSTKAAGFSSDSTSAMATAHSYMTK